jgi:hypothetical protein
MVAPVSVPAVRPWTVDVKKSTKLAKWVRRHSALGIRALSSEVISTAASR